MDKAASQVLPAVEKAGDEIEAAMTKLAEQVQEIASMLQSCCWSCFVVWCTANGSVGGLFMRWCIPNWCCCEHDSLLVIAGQKRIHSVVVNMMADQMLKISKENIRSA